MTTTARESRRTRHIAAMMALGIGVVAGIAGCSAGGPAADAGTTAHPGGGVGDDFRQHDLIVSASCEVANSGGGRLTVDGWDPQTWAHKAHTEFALPTTIVAGWPEPNERALSGLSYLCAVDPLGPGPGKTISGSLVPAMRAVFDRDFTKLAVVIDDKANNATHVGYLDRSGKLTDLTAPDAGFGPTPHEGNAVFAPDGDRVWFTSDTKEGDSWDQTHVASRPVSGPPATSQHWSGEYVDKEAFLFVVGTPPRVVFGEDVHVSPDGRRISGSLDDLGHAVTDIPAEAGRMTGRTAANRQDSPCTEMVGWTDDHTVLCAALDKGVSNFFTWDSAVPGEGGPGRRPPGASVDILPVNDRANYGMAVAPDGQRFIFVSQAGPGSSESQSVPERTFYVAGTKPGSTPTKVERRGDFAVLDNRVVLLEWR